MQNLCNHQIIEYIGRKCKFLCSKISRNMPCSKMTTLYIRQKCNIPWRACPKHLLFKNTKIIKKYATLWTIATILVEVLQGTIAIILAEVVISSNHQVVTAYRPIIRQEDINDIIVLINFHWIRKWWIFFFLFALLESNTHFVHEISFFEFFLIPQRWILYINVH